jgi:hypothetical protein
LHGTVRYVSEVYLHVSGSVYNDDEVGWCIFVSLTFVEGTPVVYNDDEVCGCVCVCVYICVPYLCGGYSCCI